MDRLSPRSKREAPRWPGGAGSSPVLPAHPAPLTPTQLHRSPGPEPCRPVPSHHTALVPQPARSLCPQWAPQAVGPPCTRSGCRAELAGAPQSGPGPEQSPKHPHPTSPARQTCVCVCVWHLAVGVTGLGTHPRTATAPEHPPTPRTSKARPSPPARPGVGWPLATSVTTRGFPLEEGASLLSRAGL